MKYQEYYTQLGRLLYAIAKVDGKVQKKELIELRRIVNEELVHLENSTDDFNTDAAFATEFEFEVLQDRGASAEEAFLSFQEFIHINADIPPKLKALAYRSALRVADSFHGTNHQEADMLHHLKELLREPAVMSSLASFNTSELLY